METLVLFVVISTITLSYGFAYDDERSGDLTKERFTRDLAKQKFAFAFAKRDPDTLEEKLRFARDIENARKFAFAKRSADLSDEDRVHQRFARELDGNKKFAFAFAKRFSGDDQLVRFARPSFA